MINGRKSAPEGDISAFAFPSKCRYPHSPASAIRTSKKASQRAMRSSRNPRKSCEDFYPCSAMGIFAF